MNKGLVKFDERETRIVRKVSSVLYILTLYSLIGIQLYRQFILHQPAAQWNDIAVIISTNALVWFGSLLYLSGAVNPKLIKIRYLIAGFAGFVILGLGFTILKYAVFLGQALSYKLILDSFFMVLKISALIAGVWMLLAYLGSRRMEKRLL